MSAQGEDGDTDRTETLAPCGGRSEQGARGDADGLGNNARSAPVAVLARASVMPNSISTASSRSEDRSAGSQHLTCESSDSIRKTCPTERHSNAKSTKGPYSRFPLFRETPTEFYHSPWPAVGHFRIGRGTLYMTGSVHTVMLRCPRAVIAWRSVGPGDGSGSERRDDAGLVVMFELAQNHASGKERERSRCDRTISGGGWNTRGSIRAV